MCMDRICIWMSNLWIIYRTKIRICEGRDRCIIFRTMHKMFDLISYGWIERRSKIIRNIIWGDSRSLHNNILLIPKITIRRMRDNRNRNIFNRLISIMLHVIVCIWIVLGVDSSVFVHGSLGEIVRIIVYHDGFFCLQIICIFYIFFLNLWNIIS